MNWEGGRLFDELGEGFGGWPEDDLVEGFDVEGFFGAHVDGADAALVGGITGLKRIAILAQEHHLTFTPHTWTNGMGVTANAHLVAGLADAPFLEFPFDPPEWSLARRDFVMAEPLKADPQGWINLSDAPGMGYALDEGRLLATRIG